MAESAATLASSANPSDENSAVTFTATISVVAPATETPVGEVVFLANGVAFTTNTLTSGAASASTSALPVGTNEVTVAYDGNDNFLGSTNSLQQVVKAAIVYSQTNRVLSIRDNLDGTFRLTFQGMPQAQYYVVTHTDIAAPPAEWTTIPASTNTVTASDGVWDFTVPFDGTKRFYRSAAVNPAP